MQDQSNPQSEKKFRAIRVASLRGDLKIPFDAFVRVAGKNILYCRQGDSFEGARLERLKSKKLKLMYIRDEDDIPYRQYLESSIDSAYRKDTGKSLALRAEVIEGFQQAAAEDYMETPLDEMSYSHVRSSVQRFTEFLETENYGLQAILGVRNTDASIAHHGVTVAALAVGIIGEMKLKTGTSLHLVALGCLLHDIETYLSEIKAVPLESMTPAEVEIYHQHPHRGAHRLQGAKFLDQTVLNIITQHEENAQGNGFPKGLTEKAMDPVVMIAATANAYDRLVCFEKMDQKEAFSHLFKRKMGLYPLPYLQALQAVLKRQKLL